MVLVAMAMMAVVVMMVIVVMVRSLSPQPSYCDRILFHTLSSSTKQPLTPNPSGGHHAEERGHHSPTAPLVRAHAYDMCDAACGSDHR